MDIQIDTCKCIRLSIIKLRMVGKCQPRSLRPFWKLLGVIVYPGQAKIDPLDTFLKERLNHFVMSTPAIGSGIWLHLVVKCTENVWQNCVFIVTK